MFVGIVLLLLVAWRYWPRDDATELAASPDPGVRAEVAAKLAQAPRKSQLPLLRDLAGDTSTEVALLAVGGIRPVGSAQLDEDSKAALGVLMADTDRDPLVRAAAAAQLGLFGDTDPQVLGSRMLDANEHSAVRAGAALGLGRLKKPESVPSLYNALRDRNPEVRARAMTAISNICLTHFRYDAAKPPEQQEENIRFIGQHLRKLGLLDTPSSNP